eukprot:gene14913-16455_t
MATSHETSDVFMKEITLKRKLSRTVSTNIDRGIKEAKLAVTLFNMILDDWMYGFGEQYSKADFILLFNRVSDFVIGGLPISFFLPGFPCKSPNQKTKVLGNGPDMSEFLGLRLLLSTARKIQAIYSHGVIITIMSDYHTFDQYIGVSEEQYNTYYEGLRIMIRGLGADDVIKLISLSNFPEFKDVPSEQISKVLGERYGGQRYLNNFDAAAEVPEVFMKYSQMKKFMLSDQSHNLPASRKANKTKEYIGGVAKGMMSQGVALDAFLKSQSHFTDYIRLSVHNHHPMSGKFAIDFFKNADSETPSSGFLRTPWHNVVVFDSKTGEFMIAQKSKVVAATSATDDCILLKVRFEDKDWFYLRLYLSEQHAASSFCKEAVSFDVQLIKASCGLILTNNQSQTQDATSSMVGGKTKPRLLRSDCISKQSMTTMIKEFGVVVLRGFEEFNDEKAMVDFYRNHRATEHGIVHWQFGAIHKINPSEDMAGSVNSYEGLPLHFNMTAPPKYMGINQAEHRYEDFICREFMLYCRQSPDEGQGGTTMVDARAVALAMNGEKREMWKKTVLSYETKLKQTPSPGAIDVGEENGSSEGKKLYFGGSGNVYEYPLVHVCPWTGNHVLRWWEQ